MPIHDWTRVPAGLFHDFHQTWSIFLKNALNGGCLPDGLTALVEQRAGPSEGDVLAIEDSTAETKGPAGGTATLERPSARIIRRTDSEFYSARANRIVVRHHLGKIVALIEIVSPGNKDRARSVREFAEKIADFLDKGVHALVVDLFPPTPRDPSGIHKAIWDQLCEEEFSFPPGTSRILAAYEAGSEKTAYVEPVALGEPLPEMPLFIGHGLHVKVPLEFTYMKAWEVTPPVIRARLLP